MKINFEITLQSLRIYFVKNERVDENYSKSN